MFLDLLPGKYLLLGPEVIADSYRLKRRVHPPRLDPATPILLPEKPWEGDGVTPLHVVLENERWRMWYQASRNDPNLAPGKSPPTYCCYADSEDGVNWQRPLLHIYPEFGGDNSICFKGFHQVAGNTFLHQPQAPPEQRYLMVNCEWPTQELGGILIAASADGIHWEYSSEQPLIFGHSDTWNSLVWNAEREVYMLYMRAWHSAAEGWIKDWVGGAGYDPGFSKNTRRRVAYSESKDLKTWSEPQIILTPDELDTNDFYGLQVFRYANYFLGQLWLHDDDARETIEVELIWSRDGRHWQRLPDRQKFIAAGEPGAPDGYMMIPAQQPVIVGDEMFHFYTGSDGPHDHPDRHTTALRGKMRVDGFISLAADRSLGALITRSFVLQSDSITINASTHSGEIRFELVEPYHEKTRGEPAGKVIEGFTAADCDAYRGDSTAHRLSWRGQSDLNTLRGRRLMLKMSLYHAEIYSISL